MANKAFGQLFFDINFLSCKLAYKIVSFLFISESNINLTWFTLIILKDFFWKKSQKNTNIFLKFLFLL